MAVNAFLSFDGNCREAVGFYAAVFGKAEPRILTFGGTPHRTDEPLPEDARHRVMYTSLEVCGSTVMFSDTFPGRPYITGNNISVAVVSKDAGEVKTIFDKLKVGGTVELELQETPWSKCYGTLTDKFGVPWQLSHDSGQV